MTAPAVGPLTLRVYAGLPELYRHADATAGSGDSEYPLLRYLSLLLDPLAAVDTLVGRLTYEPLDDRAPDAEGAIGGIGEPWQRYGTGDYGTGDYGDPDTADLVDPTKADGAWLAWLGYLVGVNTAGLDVVEQREAIGTPELTWAHGTPDVIAALIRDRLSGGQYVDVVPVFGGEPFVIGIITKRAETTTTTTWGELEAEAPTWGDLEALGSWSNLEAADALAAALGERPAGYRFRHRYLEEILAD